MAKILDFSHCLIMMVFLVTGTYTALSGAADLPVGDQQKFLRVVLPQNTKPMAYIHENETRGIYVDVLKHIADSQDIELGIQLVSLDRAHQLMLNSSADLSVAYTIVKTAMPDAIYLPFSQKLKVSFYSREDSEIEIHQDSDLLQYRIGSARIIPDLQYQGIKQQFYKSPGHQVKALKTGRVDLILIGDLGVAYWQKMYGARLKKVYPFGFNQISFLFNVKTLGERAEEYCRLFAKALTDLRRSGELKNITEKYKFSVVKRLFDSESDNSYSCVDSI